MLNNIGIVLWSLAWGFTLLMGPEVGGPFVLCILHNPRNVILYYHYIIAVVIIPFLGGQYKGYRFINRETPYSSWQQSRRHKVVSHKDKVATDLSHNVYHNPRNYNIVMYNLNYSYTHDTAINCPVIISVHKLPGEFTHRR